MGLSPRHHLDDGGVAIMVIAFGDIPQGFSSNLKAKTGKFFLQLCEGDEHIEVRGATCSAAKLVGG